MKAARTLPEPLRVRTALSPDFRWVALPSWIGSVFAHALLALLIVSLAQLPSCRRDMAGSEGESFRDVGIRLLPAAEPKENPAPAQAEAQTPQPAASPASARELPPTPDQPPVALNLPETAQASPLIGMGRLPDSAQSQIESLVKPLGPSMATESPGGTPAVGGTSFLGIQDVGRRFVYVIDRSFSMANDRALQAAKLELLASLQRLNESQQFQIIFYNNEFVVLDTRGGRFDVFRGTDAQRLRVSEQVAAIQPSGGTRHLPALLEALKFNPDVIFLLTDGAAESALDRRDLEDVRRHNRNGAHIHCIEFGRGARSALGEAGNFLKDLARENDGKYTYRNVSGLSPGP